MTVFLCSSLVHVAFCLRILSVNIAAVFKQTEESQNFDTNMRFLTSLLRAVFQKKLSDSDTTDSSDQDRTVPRYSLRYRSHVDMQDYCLDNQKSGAASKPIPDEIILTIDLPLLSDSSSLEADVLEDGWTFELQSKRKALYELKLKLPFKVLPESSKAKFEKDKRKLHVTMKTVQLKRETVHLSRSSSDESEVFEENEPVAECSSKSPKKLVEEIEKVGDTDVGYESTESVEVGI
jgi:hypothetical protein